MQVGDEGYANDGSEAENVLASAIDDVAANPNVLTTWTPSSPGGMSGVLPSNQLTTATFGDVTAPTGAVWDPLSMITGKGRLGILMDITWLESESWDQTTATQMAVNLESFLLSALPIHTAQNPRWAGFVGQAQGVRDVNGEWTVPTVDCSQDPRSSAVRIWVGIDGYGNHDLVNAGVEITCTSSTSSPCYYLFTQVHPQNETPVTACGGVSPGDNVSVDLADQLYGSTTFVATVDINGTAAQGGPFTLSASSVRNFRPSVSSKCLRGPWGPPRQRPISGWQTSLQCHSQIVLLRRRRMRGIHWTQNN